MLMHHWPKGEIACLGISHMAFSTLSIGYSLYRGQNVLNGYEGLTHY